MRVSIEHREKTSGLFMKTTQYEVLTRVDFSDEELAIIRHRKLEKTIVLERSPDRRHASKFSQQELVELATEWHLKISSLMKRNPDVHTLDTPIEAKQYEQELTDALRQLKAYIEGNAAVAGATTFEL
jgi:hypothetical protein